MPLLAFKTVRDGDRVAIWSKNGSVKVVDGPKRVQLCMQRLEHVPRYFADQSQYLEIRKREGPIEILPGPTSAFKDPVLDESIRVMSALMIDASEALVVYRGGEANASGKGGVERRVVRGPARFIPRADEWIHKFEWSGVPKDGSKTSYQPKALSFTNLRIIPSSAYHNVSEVRTNDDTLITVKLMLFFELLEIEQMLDTTNDPIGDFINAASADVIAFCATLNYETFLNETHKLNSLETFENLCARAKHIGYNITKVVFRGFQAGDKLQQMHDNAIQERTRLRLKEETEEQAQRAEDIRLHAEQRRAAKQADLEAEQQRSRADLSLATQKAKITEQQLLDEAALAKAQRRHEAEMGELKIKADVQMAADKQKFELEQQRNAELLRMMKEMKGINVDLTKVLVAQHEQPDRVIKLDTGSGSDDKAKSKSLLSALQLNI